MSTETGQDIPTRTNARLEEIITLHGPQANVPFMKLAELAWQLEDENAALKADREMLDWLEKNVSAISIRQVYFSFPGPSTLRKAIARAMKEEKP